MARAVEHQALRVRQRQGCLRLCRHVFRGILQVGGVELRQIARHALLQLGAAALHLPPREVLVSSIDRLELSRRLEREALRNVEVMWLTGRLIPDHFCRCGGSHEALC